MFPVLWSLLLALTILALPRPTVAAESLVTLGERLYRTGMTVAGKPVQAISQNDVRVSGQTAACVRCHRASGFGSSEGGYYVPPITGPLLFAPRKLDRTRLFHDMYLQVQPPQFSARLHQPHMRPAYTTTSLATTLRTGKDPAGQRLAAIMPRYELSDEDVTALAAYLRTLSAQFDPGVDDREIRFATVVSENLPPEERDAVLHTMRTYIKWHNQHLRGDRARPNFSPYHRSDFVPLERLWTLSVWTVKGSEETWRNQIEGLYRSEPAFALIGGMVQGRWDPIAEFCDDHRIPCLFPHTDLPKVTGAQGGYTLYFTRGLVLEAKVLAHFLAADSNIRHVWQIAASDVFGTVPAHTLKASLAAQRADIPQELLTFEKGSTLATHLANVSPASGPHTAIVIWPGADVRTTLKALLEGESSGATIYLPSRVLPLATDLAKDVARNFRFIDPHEISVTAHPRSFEVRAWMRTRGLAITHPILQFQAYYGLSLLEAALAGIREDYYRDYLIERVERESEKDLNPGIYPRLSLGPSQRFASKGAFIVRLDAKEPGGRTALSPWIVP